MTQRESRARRDGVRVSAPASPTSVATGSPALVAVHEATRALIATGSPREVVDVVTGLVDTLGAAVVPARLAGPDALPLDLTFGMDEPLLPAAEPASVPRLHLEVLLPTFLEDARRVVMALRDMAHLRDKASRDPVTGLLNRRSLDPRLHALRPGDAVAMLDVDQFSPLNGAAGHQAGDAVLASFGSLLLDHVRVGDLAARYGPDAIAVAMLGAAPKLLTYRLEQVRRGWRLIRPYPVAFSAGVAAVTSTAAEALGRAESALDGAKRAGRDRTEVAL